MNQNTIKPGMTLDMKAKLFAQYWGQNVYNNRNYPDDKPNQLLDHVLLHFTNDHEFLELKPLSSITDEDAIEVAKAEFTFFQTSTFNIKVVREISRIFVVAISDKVEVVRIEISNPSKLNIYAIDIVRSKGYALPWMGYSVEDMVQVGWIKLKGGK